MGTLFLTTVISCNQLIGIANRITDSKLLTFQQKTEIIFELRSLVPSCPLIIKNYDTKKATSN